MSLGTLLILILLFWLFGGFLDIGGRGPGFGYGYQFQGLPGILLIIVVFLLVTGRI